MSTIPRDLHEKTDLSRR